MPTSPTLTVSRSNDGRWLGGVCVGIARVRRVRPVWIRTAFIAASLFAGLGLVAYCACYLILPGEQEQAEAAGGARTVALAQACGLLDVHIPDGGGLAVLHALKEMPAPPPVLALSVSDAAEDVVPMIRAGALGYVTKTISTADLLEAIEFVAGGDAYFSPRLAAFVLQEFSTPAAPKVLEVTLEALTPREREVLHHLARGYPYKRIAARLAISPRTVESHVGAVLRKLQLSSRHEVAHWAARRGLIELDDAGTT